MNVPGIVQSRLDGEQVAAKVSLGGEDGLYVTRTRTLIYRADGLLSDESVEEYPHEAERIEISEGRRKSSVELDYGIDGEEKFKVPSNRLYEALHPVLAGVLNAADVTGPDETVKQTYQFSELTLVITSERVVKHVGAAVWDQDYEEFHFDDVTALDVEKGSVSSQIIIESAGRPQRIKTPSDQTREVRERIERALLEHHDKGSYEEFAREHADPDDHAEAEGEGEQSAETESASDGDADPLAGGGVAPIDANPPELDDDGAIIENEESVATAERDDEDAVSAAEASDAAAKAAAASANASEPAAGADAGSTDTQTDDSASAADGPTHSVDTDDVALTDDPADANGTATATTTGDTTENGESDGEADRDATVGSDDVSDSEGFADSGFEPASSETERDTTEEQLAALTEAVQRQNELLAEQQRTLETLIEELSRGR
ncbi:MSCRAMM family adhesin SdrC [Halorussus aquaticus]|uniref:MSCRAMM family adhesin SdrC n=1 Tax=Halorussus aquaticus TaxID=2953748 RepID=A0ABD5Q558_9EURY|nr:MSCRAMM family adhesin SdrC [Halorussus aquaticus]